MVANQPNKRHLHQYKILIANLWVFELWMDGRTASSEDPDSSAMLEGMVLDFEANLTVTVTSCTIE